MKYFESITCLIIVLLFLLSGCNNPRNNNNNKEAIPTIKVPDVGAQDGLYVENIDGLFDTIQFIRLETDSNCLIGEIMKIEFFEEKFFILDSDVTKTLFCFDRNGGFLFKINNIGKGPGEFISPVDFSINDQKKELSLLDVGSQKIITYNLNGTFIKEINYVDKFGAIDISHLHMDGDLTYAMLDKPELSCDNFIKIYDGTKEVSGSFKIDKYNWNIPSGFSSRFSRNTNPMFLYVSKTSDTIYSINKYEFKPFYYIDFQGMKVCYENINPKLSYYEKTKELLKQESYRLEGKVFKANDIIFFSFSFNTNPIIYHCFFEGKSEKLIISHFVNDENDDRFNFIDYPKGVMGDAFISPLSAGSVKNQFENLIENKKETVFDEKTLNILRSVSENDNPIIVVYR